MQKHNGITYETPWPLVYSPSIPPVSTKPNEQRRKTENSLFTKTRSRTTNHQIMPIKPLTKTSRDETSDLARSRAPAIRISPNHSPPILKSFARTASDLNANPPRSFAQVTNVRTYSFGPRPLSFFLFFQFSKRLSESRHLIPCHLISSDPSENEHHTKKRTRSPQHTPKMNTLGSGSRPDRQGCL